MAATAYPPPPRSSANPAPPRPAGSIRRTSSIDVCWPDGETGDRLFVGRARDYLTPSGGGKGRVLDEAEYRATLAMDRTITSIIGEPQDPRLDRLVGVRGGNHLRLFIKETMPEMIASAAPIYLPLDDISGTALVSGFAWSQWQDDWGARMRERMAEGELEKMMAERVNVCWGLKEGHSGVEGTATQNIAQADALDVRNPADPEGWHPLYEVDGPGFRRVRRIDVTRDAAAGLIRIDSAFQDSAKRKGIDGGKAGRVAIHEYNLVVTADANTLEILTLEPEARILPFSECPGAIHNARRLVGTSISDVRDSVLGQLRGPEGCTHLNDALRALADVPKLAEDLARAEA